MMGNFFDRENMLARVIAFLIACALWMYVMNEQNPLVERNYVVTSSYFLKKSRMEFLTAINPVIRFLPFLHRSVYLYYRHDLPGTYLAVPV